MEPARRRRRRRGAHLRRAERARTPRASRRSFARRRPAGSARERARGPSIAEPATAQARRRAPSPRWWAPRPPARTSAMRDLLPGARRDRPREQRRRGRSRGAAGGPGAPGPGRSSRRDRGTRRAARARRGPPSASRPPGAERNFSACTRSRAGPVRLSGVATAREVRRWRAGDSACLRPSCQGADDGSHDQASARSPDRAPNRRAPPRGTTSRPAERAGRAADAAPGVEPAADAAHGATTGLRRSSGVIAPSSWTSSAPPPTCRGRSTPGRSCSSSSSPGCTCRAGGACAATTAPRRRRSGGCCSYLGRPGLPDHRADLTDRPPRRAVVHVPHGPARAAARPRADRPDRRPDEGAAAAADAPPAGTRARARTADASGGRRRPLHRRDVGLARTGRLRRRAAHRPRSTCSSTSIFLSVGLLYWWQLLSPIRSRFHTTVMGPVVYMLSTKLGVGILGIVLTFAPNSIYPYYEHRPPIFGLTVDGDQSLGGEIMTLEQMIVMGVALAILLFRALEQSERELKREEHLEDLREAGEIPRYGPLAGRSAKPNRSPTAQPQPSRPPPAAPTPAARRATGAPRRRHSPPRSARAARDQDPARTAGCRSRPRRTHGERAGTGEPAQRGDVEVVGDRDAAEAEPPAQLGRRDPVREQRDARGRRAPGSGRCSSSRGALPRGSRRRTAPRRRGAAPLPTAAPSGSARPRRCSTAPSPGKCFSVAAAPPSCRPRANALPSVATAAGLRANARPVRAW